MAAMLNTLRLSVIALALTSTALSAQAPAAPQAPATAPTPPVKATPQNAAAYLGDWDLSGEGSNGPASFTLSLTSEGDALTAVLMNADKEVQTVTDISMAGSALSLNVTFLNGGAEYPSVVTLTPSAEKVALHINVAGGLAQLDGTATKKVAR
jgi:hypothetical protein